MGIRVYEDRHALKRGVDRWAGYGVPAVCDHPDCVTKIWRGENWKCGDLFADNDARHEDGECLGCGLYFCTTHRFGNHTDITPKPDTPELGQWILTDESWSKWRTEHPAKVDEIRTTLDAQDPTR